MVIDYLYLKGRIYMKKVVGIISIVLFIFVTFQSCAAGLGNALNNSKEASGSAGMILAVCMLIAGIVAIISKTNKGMTITSIVFYLIGFVIGIANVGSFGDLKVWSILNLIFAILFIIDIIRHKELYNGNKNNIESNNDKKDNTQK
jgi:Ca2+/Na+ antiporter